jgi:hypothetical protein
VGTFAVGWTMNVTLWGLRRVDATFGLTQRAVLVNRGSYVQPITVPTTLVFGLCVAFVVWAVLNHAAVVRRLALVAMAVGLGIAALILQFVASHHV